VWCECAIPYAFWTRRRNFLLEEVWVSVSVLKKCHTTPLRLQKLELAGEGPPVDKLLKPNPRRFVLFPIQYPKVSVLLVTYPPTDADCQRKRPLPSSLPRARSGRCTRRRLRLIGAQKKLIWRTTERWVLSRTLLLCSERSSRSCLSPFPPIGRTGKSLLLTRGTSFLVCSLSSQPQVSEIEKFCACFSSTVARPFFPRPPCARRHCE
jgi:hypothetical protein